MASSGLLFNRIVFFGQNKHILSCIKPWKQYLISRGSRYKASPQISEDSSVYTDFDVTADPKEWMFVEQLFPLETIPKPTATKITPSGWVPPREESKKLPYFIKRTKNHMLPVYLDLSFRDARKVTTIRHIEGDINLLEQDLRKYIESKAVNFWQKKFGTVVNELAMQIKIRGDHVNRVKQFFEIKGF